MPITPSGIEAVFKSLPDKQNPEPDHFSTQFYQTFKGLNANACKITLQNRNRTLFHEE